MVKSPSTWRRSTRSNQKYNINKLFTLTKALRLYKAIKVLMCCSVSIRTRKYLNAGKTVKYFKVKPVLWSSERLQFAAL